MGESEEKDPQRQHYPLMAEESMLQCGHLSCLVHTAVPRPNSLPSSEQAPLGRGLLAPPSNPGQTMASPCCGTRLEDGIVGDWGTASLSLATNEMSLSFV